MNLLNRSLNLLASGPLVCLVLLVNAAVIGRYALGEPIRWAEEVSGLLMIWLVMLGAIVAERDRAHLDIPVLVAALPERAGRIIHRIVACVTLATAATFGWLGWQLASSVTYKVTDLLRLSYWWIDIALAVGFGGMALVLAVRLLRWGTA